MLIQINTIILVQVTNIIITNLSSNFKKKLCAFFKKMIKQWKISALSVQNQNKHARMASEDVLLRALYLFFTFPTIFFRVERSGFFLHERFRIFGSDDICTTSAKGRSILYGSDLFLDGTASFTGFPMCVFHQNGKMLNSKS